MGRPPGIAQGNSANSSRQWTPPTWLQGAMGDSKAPGGVATGSKGPKVANQYVLSIPPVPEQIAKVIASRVSATIKPFSAQQSKIRVLTAKRNDQRERLTACEEKLAELENKKEEALSDIISARRKEKEEAVAAVEDKLRSKFDEELVAKEKKWKELLEIELDAKRKRLREKQEQQSKEEDEQAQKRLKLLEAAAEDGEEQQLLLDESNNEEVQVAKKKIEEKQEELKELEAKYKTLNDSRGEMIWLLKQVIKAEEKQKARIDRDKKESVPRVQSSRQA